MNNFNEEQIKFIDNEIKSMTLIGIPGGGKTRSIIEYVNTLYTKKQITTSNEFLIVTFSKSAQTDFINKGKKSNGKIFTNQNVRTIHSISKSILNKKNKKDSSSINTVVVSAYREMEKCNDLSDVDCLKNIKFVIVDEAQDISEIQYKFVSIISKILNIPLILVGDPNQNIYQFQNGSDKYLLEHSGENIHLIKNYRSTIEIVEFINYLRPWNNFPNMISIRNQNGPKPLIYIGSVENICQNLIQKIRSISIEEYDEIAIIGPVKNSKPSSKGIYANIGLQLIINKLNNQGIKFVQHYKNADNDNFDNKTNFKRENEHVNLLTIHTSKGLEFKYVFLINFHFTTMTRRPNIEKYNEYKYLWYVGASRAKDELTIYVDESKNIWPEFFKIPCEKYCINRQIKRYLPKFEDDRIPIKYPITKILDDNKYFPEEKLYEFEKLMDYYYEEIIDLYDTTEIRKNIYDYENFSSLYGCYIELLFIYFYHKKYDKIEKFVEKQKNRFENILEIPKRFSKIYGKFISNFGTDYLQIKQIYDVRNKLNNEEYDLFEYILQKCNNELERFITLMIENDVIDMNFKDDLIEKYDNFCNILDLNEIYKLLFDDSLFWYQVNHESKYLLKKDFTPYIDSVKEYGSKIEETIENSEFVNNNFRFHVENEHPNLPIIGIVDILNNNKIIDIKFVKNITSKYIMQILLYYNNIFPDWKKRKNLELWNLYEGKIYKINFNNHFTNYDILKLLCRNLKIRMYDNIFIYDLETTGREIDNLDIIERYFEEYNLKFSPSSGLIKINYPLSFNIINLTHITDNDLIKNGENFSKFKEDMLEIFKYCDNPILIAHNGHTFDHKILQSKELINTDEGNKCRILDSRTIIRMFYTGKDLWKYCLGDMYREIIGKGKENTHRAKVDVEIMVEIFEKLGIKAEDIINLSY